MMLTLFSKTKKTQIHLEIFFTFLKIISKPSHLWVQLYFSKLIKFYKKFVDFLDKPQTKCCHFLWERFFFVFLIPLRTVMGPRGNPQISINRDIKRLTRFLGAEELQQHPFCFYLQFRFTKQCAHFIRFILFFAALLQVIPTFLHSLAIMNNMLQVLNLITTVSAFLQTDITFSMHSPS